MKHFTAASAALLLVGASVILTAPARAAEATCQGRPATIVATTDNERLQGREDADVIVVGGFDSVHVDGNGGDDILCATSGHEAVIDGGPGDDVLEDRPSTGEIDESERTVLLGGSAGDDTFLGGRETELSYEESEAGVAIDLEAGSVVHRGGTDSIVGINRLVGSDHADTFLGSSGVDVYRTEKSDGAGGDRVATGAGADLVWATDATVDLGAGDDSGSVDGGTMSGGAGDDTIGVHQEGTANGGPGGDHLSASLDVPATADPGPARLRGGAGDDVLEPPVAYSSDAAAGEDLGDCPEFCARGALDGGAGTDRLDLGYTRRAVVDLGAGRLRVKGGRSALRGVEDVRGSRFADVIRGDRHPNRIGGKGGDDVLDGRGGPDRLSGGSGRDRAFGGAGRDRCVAERRTSC